MRIVLVGATGYIGTHFATTATIRGHNVVRTFRAKPTIYDESWLYFDLESNEKLVLPAGTDVVVHMAANTRALSSVGSAAEVVASQRLIKSSQKIGAKFIFVSSQTACVDAPTYYGKTKWRIEQEVLAAAGWVIRPGQVYGGELRGLYGTLVSSVAKLWILPAFLPTPRVQPIHVGDLVEALLRIAERPDLNPGVYCLGSTIPISFSSFLAEIAKSRLNCRRLFVPVPVFAVNFLVWVVGPAWSNKLGLVRLRSLFNLPEMATESDLNSLGLSLRSLSAGLHPSGDDRRRGLLFEGQALLTYILKQRPDKIMSRRYARAIESLRGGRAIELPNIFLNFPILLSLLNNKSWSDESLGAEFICRLDTATLLAEASPIGATRFLGIGDERGLLSCILSLTYILMMELCWRLIRAFLSPALRLSMARPKSKL
jgi:nucleoside-diphosphate-sugar epimerase